ncbi:hypothetical protein DRE_03206 [Drechslerella stenobrocha 248]|uniref:Uncharacterized protein n=1 Tax=Drechslerella stenobrocha 248 TaxID=1043628 RepID=W7HTV5_9PEZI|nr:hypothetical protein DRE_03206 [Drechslerella stenobrocha 248]
MFMENDSRSYETRLQFHRDLLQFHRKKLPVVKQRKFIPLRLKPEISHADILDSKPSDNIVSFHAEVFNHGNKVEIASVGGRTTPMRQLDACLGIGYGHTSGTLDSIESRIEMSVGAQLERIAEPVRWDLQRASRGTYSPEKAWRCKTLKPEMETMKSYNIYAEVPASKAASRNAPATVARIRRVPGRRRLNFSVS